MAALLVLSGCGSDPQTVNADGTAIPPPSPSPTVAFARVYSDRLEVGSRVGVTGLPEVITNGSGVAVFRTGVPQAFHATATLANGVVLESDYEAFNGRREHVVINVATSVVSRYRRLHPGLSQAAAEQRFREHFQVRPGQSSRTLSNLRAGFALRASSNPEAFLQSLAAEIDRPSAKGVVPAAGPGVFDDTASSGLQTFEGFLGSLVPSLCNNLFGYLVSGELDLTGFGWTLEGVLGFFFSLFGGTDTLEPQILDQLAAISNFLVQMNSELNQDFLELTLTTQLTALGPTNSTINTGLAIMNQLSSGTADASASVGLFETSMGLSLANLTLMNTTLSAAIPEYVAAAGNVRYYNFSAWNNTNAFYRSWADSQAMAAGLIANVQNGVSPPNTTLALLAANAAVNGVALQRSLLPDPPPPNVIIDRSNAKMWYYQVQAPMQWSDIEAFAQSATYGGYSDWRWANAWDLETLTLGTTLASAPLAGSDTSALTSLGFDTSQLNAYPSPATPPVQTSGIELYAINGGGAESSSINPINAVPVPSPNQIVTAGNVQGDSDNGWLYAAVTFDLAALQAPEQTYGTGAQGPAQIFVSYLAGNSTDLVYPLPFMLVRDIGWPYAIYPPNGVGSVGRDDADPNVNFPIQLTPSPSQDVTIPSPLGVMNLTSLTVYAVNSNQLACNGTFAVGYQGAGIGTQFIPPLNFTTDLTQSVFWSSSNAFSGSISNLPTPSPGASPSPVPAGSPVPFSPGYQGAITWLQGGSPVTFTASRGSFSANLTVTPPPLPSPTLTSILLTVQNPAAVTQNPAGPALRTTPVSGPNPLGLAVTGYYSNGLSGNLTALTNFTVSPAVANVTAGGVLTFPPAGPTAANFAVTASSGGLTDTVNITYLGATSSRTLGGWLRSLLP